MNRTPSSAPRRAGRRIGFAALLLLLAGFIFSLGGCACQEGGSSLPWAQPEPWEQQPRLGVPM